MASHEPTPDTWGLAGSESQSADISASPRNGAAIRIARHRLVGNQMGTAGSACRERSARLPAVDTLIGALWGVVASIGVSALLFVGANRLFDLSVDHWRLFVASVGALGGAVFFWVLVGNHLVNGPGVVWVAGGVALGAALALAPPSEQPAVLLLAW